MKITEEFINEQRAIAAKATPRPWWRGQHHEETIENLNTWLGQMPLHHEWLTLFMVGAGEFGDDGNEDNIRIPAVTGNGPASEANMHYIVEATNNYPAALDEIERLRDVVLEFAKPLLLTTMQDFSEAAYCAGWMHGIENVCKETVGGTRNGYGALNDDEFDTYKNKLKYLHDLCKGWWYGFVSPDPSEWYKFIPDEGGER